MRPEHVFISLAVVTIVLLGYELTFPLPFAGIMVKFLGLAGFYLLCASLLIGPLAVLWPKKFAPTIKARKIVGVASFVLVLMHFLLILATVFNWQPELIFGDFSLWIAIPAIAILLILAITSTDYALRKLGGTTWKNIQRMAYIAFVLSFVHFIFVEKAVLIQNGNPLSGNPAELFAIFLGITTIGFQIKGFLIRRNMLKAAKKINEKVNA